MENFDLSLVGVLNFLITAGGAAIVASWILERFPAYKNMPSSDGKRWIYFGVCVFLALGSFAVITFVPAAVLAVIAPWFIVVAAIFVNVWVGESFHKNDKL